MTDFPRDFLRFLRAARRIVVLTGAGISAESGLRTFRDAQTGIWAQYRPEELGTPEAFARNPKLVWDWYATRRAKAAAAKPNPAHYALAEMARAFGDWTIVTQNVDGLHTKAGSPNVLELHGNLQRVKCSQCGKIAHSWKEGEEVPRCEECGGLLRPDVVWFGERLPPEVLLAAAEASRSCDVFFSIGTSAVVQPAASLFALAEQRGALLIEINLEPTPFTPHADFAFHGKAGEILPALRRAIESL